MTPVACSESGSVAIESNRDQIESVRIYLTDQVKDGCWTNADDVRKTAESTFRQNGIEVIDSPFGFFGNYPGFRKIVIRAVGYRTTSGMCLASLSITSNILVLPSSEGFQGSVPEAFAKETIGNYLLSDNSTLDTLFTESARASLTDFLRAIHTPGEPHPVEGAPMKPDSSL